MTSGFKALLAAMMTCSIDFIDRITMYRLVLYYLLALARGGAFLLGFFKLIAVDPTALAFSAVLIPPPAGSTNRSSPACSAPCPTSRSCLHHGAHPGADPRPGHRRRPHGGRRAALRLGLGHRLEIHPCDRAASISSTRRRSASRFPALLLDQPATWWFRRQSVAAAVRPGRRPAAGAQAARFDLSAPSSLANLAGNARHLRAGAILTQLRSRTLLHSPFFFFAFVMLTEPLTAPQHRLPRIAYGALVGLLACAQHPFRRLLLHARDRAAGRQYLRLCWSAPRAGSRSPWSASSRPPTALTTSSSSPDRPLAFRPGQYLEWTLRCADPDDRGNRRYFTIASAPTEDEIRLGVKFYPQASAFKRALAEHASPAT